MIDTTGANSRIYDILTNKTHWVAMIFRLDKTILVHKKRTFAVVPAPGLHIDKAAADELFARVADIITTKGDGDTNINRMLHETLALACGEALRDSEQAFGNLFSQVDFLCKSHHVGVGDIMAIQNTRRESNKSLPLSPEDTMYACRALCVFISAIFSMDIPAKLTGKIPPTNKPPTRRHRVDYRCVRCIVRSLEDTTINVEMDENTSEQVMRVDYSASDLRYLGGLLREGMQLNLLDCEHASGNTLTPRMIIVEPDFLVDISEIARCFTDYGHNPLAYIVNRMMPSANSQAILLGNFAGKALDDVINQGGGEYRWTDTFIKNFKDKAVEYCSCDDLDSVRYKALAHLQAGNIAQIVARLFSDKSEYERGKAVLEPSFVCEQLGVQGRVDLMTTDFKLLVEQKSGRNTNVEHNFPNRFGSYQKEDHYVQLLLYYGVLRHNFNLSKNRTDTYLLYSKYPLPGGLVLVNFYNKLFAAAIESRNRIVANEFGIATHGFHTIINAITLDEINENGDHSEFFGRYVAPRLNAVISPLHGLPPLERAYFCRMMTFVCCEQLAAKMGTREDMGACGADLWNMPLAEKRETGSIYTNLSVVKKEESGELSGYDTITLRVPDQGENFLPNFRRGDMVYLYQYDDGKEPDVRASILYKGVLAGLSPNEIVVHLNDSQQNPDVLSPIHDKVKYAIEHGDSDIGTRGAIRGLHAFITSTPSRKALLLSLREPERDERVTLSRSYNTTYDEILTRARQARDYFLLIGPPGTGKTSMALKYIVEEELTSGDGNILLMAYTNRAVDEICDTLVSGGVEFIRMGNKYACDERFRGNLIGNVMSGIQRMSDIRQGIASSRVFVGTTSSMANAPGIFNIKQFSLAVIDEASQILEPNVIGLLSLCHEGDPAIGKFILIGDYKQLPAVVRQNAATSRAGDPLLNNIMLDDCRVSLFERLLKWERAQNRRQFIGVLRKQGRMHPDVAEFPASMFYANEGLEPVPCPHQKRKTLGYKLASRDILDKILKTHRMVFIPSKPCRQPDISDKVNVSEARIAADLLLRVRRFYGERFNAQATVGVIVPYRNQIAMIRKEVQKLGVKELDDVSVDTVERYQGSQRDVIIYSFTIQQTYQLDFLTANRFVEDGHVIDRKLNVALTRAREQMIITGNEATLSADKVFSDLIDYVKGKGGYVPR